MEFELLEVPLDSRSIIVFPVFGGFEELEEWPEDEDEDDPFIEVEPECE